MAPPAGQRLSWLKMIWMAAVSKSWTGLSRFAPHLQCISLVLATAQLVLGSYIFNSLLHYGKWVEACYGPYAHNPDYLSQAIRPPFTAYTQDDPAAGMKKMWVGAFSALKSKEEVVAYALLVPLCTVIVAGSAVYKHFNSSSISLQLALYIGLWQTFGMGVYMYPSAEALAVDWYYADTQTRFKGVSVCFVDRVRAKAILGAKRQRMGCLEALEGVAAVAGMIALLYTTLCILAIYRAARESCRAQNAYNADVRLQNLQSHPHSHSHSTRRRSSLSRQDGTRNGGETQRPLPHEETAGRRRSGSGDAGELYDRRSSMGSLGHVDNLSEEDVSPFSDPVRPRDMV